MKQNTFNIYIMSVHRANVIKTHKFLEYYTVVVRENEAQDYKNAGIENLLIIPNGEVNDFMSTLWYIINKTPEDVICVLDDDCIHFDYRLDNTTVIKKINGEIDKETITSEIERIGQLIFDMDIGLATDTASRIPQLFNQEFTFVGMPGHMRWINKKCLKAKYNKNDFASSDIDMVYQELLVNRIILQTRYFLFNSVVNQNNSESRQEQLIFIEAMKNKWGRYYDFNKKRNNAIIKIQR